MLPMLWQSRRSEIVLWILTRNVEMCGCNKFKSAKHADAPKRPTAPRAAPAPAAAPITFSQPPLETVDTSVWGAPLWRILHIAAQASGGRTILPLWRNLLETMKTGLPCPDCSGHYNAWYNSHPLRFGLIPRSFQGPIVRWILDLHNDVNRRLGRPSWTVAQVATYAGQVGTARTLADSLRGVIGPNVSAAIDALLRVL